MRRRTALFLLTIPFLLVLGWAATGTVLAGGGCHQETEASATEASATTTVKLDGCTFAPTITRVPVGTAITWINTTDGVHDVVGRKFEWSSQPLERGATYARAFAKPGVYPYSCSFHPGMAGIVVVGSPATAEAADIQQAAAIEPVDSGSSSDGSAVPLLAAGAVGLLGGLALGAVGVRAFGRRDEAA